MPIAYASAVCGQTSFGATTPYFLPALIECGWTDFSRALPLIQSSDAQRSLRNVFPSADSENDGTYAVHKNAKRIAWKNHRPRVLAGVLSDKHALTVTRMARVFCVRHHFRNTVFKRVGTTCLWRALFRLALTINGGGSLSLFFSFSFSVRAELVVLEVSLIVEACGALGGAATPRLSGCGCTRVMLKGGDKGNARQVKRNMDKSDTDDTGREMSRTGSK